MRERVPHTPLRQRLAGAFLRPFLREQAADVIAELEELRELECHKVGRLRASVYYGRQVLSYPLRLVLTAIGDVLRRQRADRRSTPAWLLQDAREAARVLARAPRHPVITVATLGLGIAAVTVVFSLLNTLRWAPLPFPDADGLVVIQDVVAMPGRPDVAYTPSPRTMLALREVAPELESVAGHRFASFVLSGVGEPTQTIGSPVTDGWLRTLGIEPVLGRGFSAEDEAAGAGARVALVGHDLWLRSLGGDPGVIGRSVLLNGVGYTVVGIMPPGFRFPWGAEVWVLTNVEADDTVAGLGTVARLARGIEGPRLREALEVATRRTAALYPDSHSEIRIESKSMRDYLVDNRAGVAWVLLMAVGMMLLLACANVAGLSTVRVVGRERELAIRSALGCGRRRLFRLVLLESGILSAAGGVVGLFAAWLVKDGLRALTVAPESGIGLIGGGIEIDLRVVGFATLATGVTALLAGTLPAIRAVNGAGVESLLRGRGAGKHRATGSLLSGTVIAQAAAASALLIVAVAVGQAFLALDRSDRGYETTDRLVFRTVLPEERYPGGLGRWRRLDELTQQLRELPEVVEAGFSHHLPMTPGDWVRQYTFEPGPDAELTSGEANARWVGPQYFDAMDIDLVAGRTFSRAEMERGADVVIVSADVAARFGSVDRIVGARLKLGALDDESPWLEIVGVARRVREEWSFPDTLYLPYSSRPHEWVEIVAHLRPGTTAGALAARLRQIDPEQPVDNLRRLADMQAEDLRAERLATLVIALLALSGLGITVLGTYGLVSYRVRLRRRELGVRMALGCGRSRIMMHVLQRSLRLLVLGFAVGVAISIGAVLPFILRGAADGLVQVQLLARGLTIDPGYVAATLAMVLATAALACLGPALRAATAAPVRILRGE